MSGEKGGVHHVSGFSVVELGGLRGSGSGNQRTGLDGLKSGEVESRMNVQDLGSLNRTATGLSTLEMGNGLKKCGANFLHMTFRGRSLVDSQTLWLTW